MQIKKWMLSALLFTAIILLNLNPAVPADDKIAAEEFLKSKLDRVFEVLQKDGLGQEAKNKEIVETVTPMFDFALMAKLSLGKTHWPGLTQEKKDRFTELFIKRLRGSYLNKLTAYTDEKIIYEPPVEVNKKFISRPNCSPKARKSLCCINFTIQIITGRFTISRFRVSA